jgi:hypothetical protein
MRATPPPPHSAQVDSFVQLPADNNLPAVQRNVDSVLAHALDVLVYPEVGMHAPTYAMACRRLAPVQISTHGNSETSGLPDAIDYFVSFDAIEADAGQAHYSEQLVRLGGAHSLFTYPMHLAPPGRVGAEPARAPPSPSPLAPAGPGAVPRTRSSSHVDPVNRHLTGGPLGGVTALELLHHALSPVCGEALARPAPPLPPGGQGQGTCPQPASPVYLCPQTLYKLHPGFDGVLASVLARDPCGVLLLLEGSVAHWDLAVVKRLADAVVAATGAVPRHALFDERRTPPAVMCAALAGVSATLARLVVGPQRGHNAFLELLAMADVVVDTYPFGKAGRG